MTGLTRATARRSLITLTSLGYVETEDNTYRLTPKVIELATGYFNSNDGWVTIAAPYLEVLRNRVEEMCPPSCSTAPTSSTSPHSRPTR